jgi:hypothetical protein
VRAVVFRNPRRTRGLISLAGPRSRPLQGWSRGEEEEEQEQEQEGGGELPRGGPRRERGGPRDRLRTRYAAWRKNAAEPAGLLRVAPRYAARVLPRVLLPLFRSGAFVAPSSRISSSRQSGVGMIALTLQRDDYSPPSNKHAPRAKNAPSRGKRLE